MLEAPNRDDLVALLAWYQDVGVDCVLGEQPVDWLARGASPPGADFVWPEREAQGAGTASPRAPAAGSTAEQSRAAPRPAAAARPGGTQLQATRPGAPRPAPQHGASPAARTPPSRFATSPPDTAETEARRIAAAAGDLAALAAALDRFDGCALKATAKSTCVYRGAEKARLMIIGEAPGRDEDLEGRPFVGPAGRLLDRMLAAIDLDESAVHITNVVYWRPPGNRTPTPQETQVCRPFLERQIALVEPEVLLLLGGAATKALIDTPEGIMKLRGKWRDVAIAGRTLKTMASLHPAYLLRTPAAKRLAWRQLLAVKSIVGNSSE